jgi:ABC-type glycerol-3-phosphate transport system permease component
MVARAPSFSDASARGGPRVVGWVGYAIFVALGFVTLLPIFWMVSTSLKPLSEAMSTPIQWIPFPPKWDNYPAAMQRFAFVRYTFNTVFISVAHTVLTVLLSAFAGYSLAKFRYFGQRVIFLAILSTLMLPIEVLMVPTFLVVKQLGWLNTYQGIIVPEIATAFGIFLMRQYMQHIPDALVEAARIDGASELRTFFSLIMPLSWPAILTLTILTFRSSWDSFVWPYLVTTNDNLRTLPLGIQLFQQQYYTDYSQVMAISTMAFIPLVIMFAVFQRGFIQGVALSGIKE